MTADYKGVTSLQIIPNAKARIGDIELDSPRSILACQRVGVLPQELNFCQENSINESDPEKRRLMFEAYEKDRVMALAACLNEFQKICDNGVTLAESIAFPKLANLLPRSRANDPRVRSALEAIQKRYSPDEIEQRLINKQVARRKHCMTDIISAVLKEDRLQERMSASATLVDQNKQVRQKEMAKRMEQLLQRQEIATEKYNEAQKIADKHSLDVLRKYQLQMKNTEQNLKEATLKRQKEAALQASKHRKHQQMIEAKRREEDAERMQQIDQFIARQQEIDSRLETLRNNEQTKRMLQSEKLNMRLISASMRADQLYLQKVEQQRADLKHKNALAEQRRNDMLQSQKDTILHNHLVAREAQKRRIENLEQEREFQLLQRKQKIAEEDALFAKRKSERLRTCNRIARMAKLKADLENEIHLRRKERTERMDNYKRTIQSAHDNTIKEKVARQKEEVQHRAESFRDTSFKVKHQTETITQQIRDTFRQNKVSVVRQAASVVNRKPLHGEEDGFTKALAVISHAQKPHKRIDFKGASNVTQERLEKVPNDLYGQVRLAEKSGGFIDYASIRLVKPGAYRERILKSQQTRPRSAPTNSASWAAKYSVYELA
ncbi:Chromosome segregation protein SMC [Giardia duodenalis]|uniref:Trichohyalin n=2 Tax=Giardia intestinalis TaxID=5741 RepID=C6LWJ2_GIAIB|nr:Trichohyalin [Giardia intestinalis ATCC 50581]ESU43552.1 Chromosome segregation protein SMC [Giardia intestinalis]